MWKITKTVQTDYLRVIFRNFVKKYESYAETERVLLASTMARGYNQDVELDLYFKDRSSLYDGWDDGDMYDFTPSFSRLSLKPSIHKEDKALKTSKHKGDKSVVNIIIWKPLKWRGQVTIAVWEQIFFLAHLAVGSYCPF